jgi:hypothetical protein
MKPVMKRFLGTIAVVISLAPVAPFAQERVGDATLGGLSGAIVLGPVGAVAGIVIGYTAGPSISRGWGLNRDRPHAGRPAARPVTARSKPAAVEPVQSASAVPPKPPAAAKAAWDAPPVAGFE